eukprot:11305071-Heterocapsa_arctica.AAC.1
MSVVQSFDQTVQDHTKENTSGSQTTASDKSKWSTTIWQHDIKVEITITNEKGNGNISFVIPHSEWGRSAALLPDGALEGPPPKFYANGRRIIVYPTFRKKGKCWQSLFPLDGHQRKTTFGTLLSSCLLYTSPSPRDA